MAIEDLGEDKDDRGKEVQELTSGMKRENLKAARYLPISESDE